MYRSIILALVALFASFAIVGCIESPMTPDELADEERETTQVFAPGNVTAIPEGMFKVEKITLQFVNNSGKAQAYEINRISDTGEKTLLAQKIQAMKVGEVIGYVDNLEGYTGASVSYEVRMIQKYMSASSWAQSNKVTLK